MRNLNLFTAILLPLALTAACTDDSGSAQDPLRGGCTDSCHDTGGDTGGGNGGDSGGDSGGNVDVGVDVDADLDLDAELSLKVIGSGVYLGLSPLTCLDLSGDFSVRANAEARLDGDAYVIANVDANASIDLGTGCSCSGLDVDAIAAVEVEASIDANVETCHDACLNKGAACESACNQDGNTIKARAWLDASACAALGIRIGADNGHVDLGAFVGLHLNLDLDAVVNLDGLVVVDLD